MVNKPVSADADFKLLRLTPQLYDNKNDLNIDAGNIIYLDCTAPNVSSGTNDDSAAANVTGFSFTGVPSARVKDNATVSVIKSDQAKYTSDGKKAYVINAIGTAPSYFNGDILGGGTDSDSAAWSIANDGNATFAGTLQADNYNFNNLPSFSDLPD